MILKAENIEKSFRRKQVLKGVTFGIERGKMIGIVGENGSGKSKLVYRLLLSFFATLLFFIQ